ncbi:MAG TPA: hypothetical protein VL860_04040, partial [Planctomycetota bacterium]|nr:hypothetical protein [Planctomycetota bacterium]
DLAATEAGKPGEATTLVYLGDGIASAGEQRAARLIEHIGAKFAGLNALTGYAVATGGSYESAFIDGLGRQLHGLGLHVDGLNGISGIVGQVTDATQGGLLTDLTVTLKGVTAANQYPEVLPNLRLGDQLILTGRYTGSGNATLVVAGKLNGKAWSKEFTTQFPEGEVAGTNKFVPRLWAKRHINALLNKMDLEEGDLAAMKAQIIDASKKYTLITPFTSFLVLESEDDFRRFQVEHNFNMSDFGDESKQSDEKEGQDAPDETNAMSNQAAAKALPSAPAANAPARDLAGKEAAADKPADGRLKNSKLAPAQKQAQAGEQSKMEKMDALASKDLERASEADDIGGDPSGSMNRLQEALSEPQSEELERAEKKVGNREANADFKGKSNAESLRKKPMESNKRAELRRGLDALDEDDGEVIESVKSLDAVEESDSRDRSRYDRQYQLGALQKEEEKAMVGSGKGGGGSYGYRAGGGRRMAVSRHGGSKATEQLFPDGAYAYMPHANERLKLIAEGDINAALDDSLIDQDLNPAHSFFTMDTTSAPATIGEYKVVASQLPQAIDDKSKAILAKVTGKLSELGCELSPIDIKTNKVGTATESLRIRTDAVEHRWLTGAKAVLVSDGAWTTLSAGEATALRRKAQPGDRFLVLKLAPAFVACTIDELAMAFDVAFVSEKDGIATLRFTERNTERAALLVTIDTAKGEVRSIAHLSGDTLQDTTEFGGYQEIVPGVSAPTTMTLKNGDGRVTSAVAFGGFSAKAK